MKYFLGEGQRSQRQQQRAAAPASFKSTVQKMADDWKAAFQAKGAEKVATMYSDDAVWINPEGTFHGPNEIKGELKKMIDRGDTMDAITTTKAVHFARIAYAEGTYSGTAQDKKKREEVECNHVND